MGLRVWVLGLSRCPDHVARPQRSCVAAGAAALCTGGTLSTLCCAVLGLQSADWCKYNDCVLATASVDKSIKVWDVRAPEQPLSTLLGHTCAPLPGPIPHHTASLQTKQPLRDE